VGSEVELKDEHPPKKADLSMTTSDFVAPDFRSRLLTGLLSKEFG
jgi:hypothetical protein